MADVNYSEVLRQLRDDRMRVDRGIRAIERLTDVPEAPPTHWARTDEGTWVGIGGDGRPWVAYLADELRP